jgi:hypothetical protein
VCYYNTIAQFPRKRIWNKRRPNWSWRRNKMRNTCQIWKISAWKSEHSNWLFLNILRLHRADINFILLSNKNKNLSKHNLVFVNQSDSVYSSGQFLFLKEFKVYLISELSDIILFISLEMDLSRIEFNLMPVMELLFCVFIVLKAL